MGDNTAFARPGVFAQAMEQLRWLQPDLVLHVGDLIEGHSSDHDELRRQWRAIEAPVAKAGLPFVCAPGNHDVTTAAAREVWLERRGPRYGSFVHKDALFLVLDSERSQPELRPVETGGLYAKIMEAMKTDEDRAMTMVKDMVAKLEAFGDLMAEIDHADYGEEQLAFVRDNLERHRDVRWTFVVTHKPAWKDRNPQFQQIQALLSDRRYTMFAGHTHRFEHQVIDGAEYITMSTTGAIGHKGRPETMDHIMLVTLADKAPVLCNIRLSGLMDASLQTGHGPSLYA